MARILHIADPHFVSTAGEEYRFECLNKIEPMLDRCGALAILGDLTHDKDSHDAKLVTEITERLWLLSRKKPVYLLIGNHDYIEPKNPFFGFLDKIKNIEVIKQPMALEIAGTKVIALPHTRKESDLKDSFERLYKANPDVRLVWTHQNYLGSIGENGRAIEGGFNVSKVFHAIAGKEEITVVGGDIHVPQKVGIVTYCGAINRLQYGDAFTPRILDYTDGQLRSKELHTIRKASIRVGTVTEAIDQIKSLSKGDRCKVAIEMSRDGLLSWESDSKQIRQAAENAGVLLKSLEPVVIQKMSKKTIKSARKQPLDVFKTFCEHNSIDGKIFSTGERIISALDRA